MKSSLLLGEVLQFGVLEFSMFRAWTTEEELTFVFGDCCKSTTKQLLVVCPLDCGK